MSDEKTPIEELQALRGVLVDKRRHAVKAAIDPDLAKRGNVTANFERHVSDAVSLQAQIEAIDRAIVHEETLEPSFVEAMVA